jgi:hypothetical protein
MQRTRQLALFSSLLFAACATTEEVPQRGPEAIDPPSALGDPAAGEVPLECAPGWEARMIFDAGAGVWAVKTYDLFEQYAVPEVVALDDFGRCNALISYSGKFTPKSTVHDGKWLAPTAQADIDPRAEGSELYVSGQSGNVYQVLAYRHGAMDSRLIAHLPGREVHTLVAGELDPDSPGEELLAFTRPGELFQLKPDLARTEFEVTSLGELSGRIRDAIVLPATGVQRPRVATVSRTGEFALLELAPAGPSWKVIHALPMGMGRIARRPAANGASLVLYTSCDDGRVLRHEELADGTWSIETIYDGPQGARGLAAGRFTESATVECVALHGYSGEVELLTGGTNGWSAETIFTDIDKGHWLETCELDGRNATDELLATGYSGRVVLLSRPVGY